MPTRLLRLSLLDSNSSRATCTSFPSSGRFPWAGNSDYYCEHRASYCMLGSVSGSLRRNGNSTRGSFSSPLPPLPSPSPPLAVHLYLTVCFALFRGCIVHRTYRIRLPEHRAATSRRGSRRKKSRVHFRGARARAGNYARLWSMNDKLCTMYIYQPRFIDSNHTVHGL